MERDGLQLAVAGLPGGGESLIVSLVRFGIAALQHQDLGGLPEASGEVAMVAKFAVNQRTALRDRECLVELPGITQCIG